MTGWHLLGLAALGLLAAWAVLWLTIPRVTVIIAGDPGDPYAAEVARFRREVHDWDRGA